MARYQIQNALRSSDIGEFETDEKAWNTLRKTWAHGHFMWLWKEIDIEVPINNEASYVQEYNAKYGPRPIGYGGEDAKLMKVGEKNIGKVWIPVLRGITSDEYNVI